MDSQLHQKQTIVRKKPRHSNFHNFKPRRRRIKGRRIMETINIKGKEYIKVAERVKAFRNNFKDWALISEIIEMTNDSIMFKASIINPEGAVKATGFAKETLKKNSQINATSMVENCETSAWGRALGNFGIGVDKDICTAEDMINKETQSLPEALINAINEVKSSQELNAIYKREFNDLETAELKAEFVSLCTAKKQELNSGE